MRNIFIIASIVIAISMTGCHEGGSRIFSSQPLLNAARDNPAQLRSLLSSGTSVHQRDSYGNTALHVAADYGNVESIDILLGFRAPVNAMTSSGTTPLHLAVKWRDDSTSWTRNTPSSYLLSVERLLMAGANPNQEDSFGDTPTRLAAYFHNAEALKRLIERNGDVNAVNAHGQNALHAILDLQTGAYTTGRPHYQKWAFSASYSEPVRVRREYEQRRCLELVLAKGVSLEVVDGYKRSLLHYAPAYGDVEFYKEVLSKNSNRINDKDTFGETPVHAAVVAGNMPVAELLFAYGPDLLSKDNKGNTLLHVAVSHGQTSMFNRLLQLESRFVLSAQNNEGDTLLHLAASNRHNDIVEELLRRNPSDLSLQNRKRETCLHKAAEASNIDVLVRLLESASTDAKKVQDLKGRTLLHTLLLNSGSLERVLPLIPREMLDLKDCEGGNTALHYAVRKTDKETISRLRKYGASANIANLAGETPITYIEKKKQTVLKNSKNNSIDDEVRRFDEILKLLTT